MNLICRTCLAYNNELEPLFSKQLVDIEYKEITTMLHLCTGLKISEKDKLSNTICVECIESIIAAFKYRKKVWNSNTILLETKKMLEDVAGNDINVEKINTCTETKPESLNDETSEFDSPYDISHIADEQTYIEIGPDNEGKVDEIKAIPTNHKSYKNMDKFIRVADKTSTIQTYDTDEQNSLPYDISRIADEKISPLYDKSSVADEQNYIEIWADDKKNIDELIATPNIHKTYKNIDKFIRVADKSTTIRPYICTVCNQTYELIDPLHKHLLTNHNVRVLKAFRCLTCSKTFINEKDFQRHINYAHLPEPNQKNVCDICGRGFEFRNALLQHINRHNGIKKFKCEICEFRTVALSDLKVHLRSHTGEKPYVCHICGIGFITSSHRGLHIKESHSDGIPYECKICAKTYRSQSSYRSHMLTHNHIPNRNIKCDICHKEFNYQRKLTIHMRRQHGEKTYKCTVCDHAFFKKQNCQTHMKNVHNVIMSSEVE